MGTEPTGASDLRHRARTRPAVRRVVIGLGALVFVGALAAVTAVQVAGIADDLQAADDHLDRAAASLTEGDLDEARHSLGLAEELVLDANESLRTSLTFDLLGWLPVAKENIRSLESSVDLATTVIHGGVRVLDVARPLESPDGTLEVSLSDGTVPLDAVTAVEEELAGLYAQLVVRDRPDDSSVLLGPVRELRTSVVTEAAQRQHQIDVLSRGLRLVQEVVGGNGTRRYLLAIANTAEMRGTGGMMLNYGVLEGDGGTVDLTAFGRVGELAVAPPLDPAASGLPEDYLQRWEGFDVTREWRNATLSGDFTLVAPALEQMYERASGLPANGVIQVDPAGLAAILEGVGPVTVPELGEVTSENVEALVLNEAYRRFPGVEERTDVLGDVAEAAFTRLVEGEYPSIRTLAEAIAEAVDGRHIVVHSSTPSVADAISSFRADGALPDATTLDHAHLTVQNMSGNKLDYYLDTHLEIRGVRRGGQIGSWNVDITLTNTAPAGETTPQYIFGPIDAGQTAGTYRGAVSLYLPTGASLEGSSEGPFRLPPSVHTEDGRPLVGFWVDVPAGESRTVSLTVRLPPVPADEEYELTLVPSARVRPTTAAVRVETDRGQAEADVVLDRTWVIPERGPAQPLSAV